MNDWEKLVDELSLRVLKFQNEVGLDVDQIVEKFHDAVANWATVNSTISYFAKQDPPTWTPVERLLLRESELKLSLDCAAWTALLHLALKQKLEMGNGQSRAGTGDRIRGGS